ncbi:MAG: LysM peptidoglycan-binding domain-containing protein [Caldilineaceae bacterium]
MRTRATSCYNLPMAQEQLPQIAIERRCPNCGTRVARDAESCFMCGYDLRIRPRRKQRVSWIDTLLVVAVLGVLGLWWQIGAQQATSEATSGGDVIAAGDVPVLGPTAEPTATLEPTVTPTPLPPERVLVTHEVRPGENLLAIAGFYGVTVAEIQAANNLDSELIRVGDRLNIPVERTPQNPLAPAQGNASFNYVVQEKDTIVSISILFGSSVNDILAANNLAANDIIRPGQVLVVPVRNVPDEVVENATANQDAGAVTAPQPNDDANRIYIEPRLTGPPDDAVLSREEAVLLRWLSVDILAPNEWYVLQIISADGNAPNIPPVWTKTTSYRLPVELAPAAGESATYDWQVSVIRVKSSANQTPELEATSPPSQPRTFTWQ